jgi:sulfatase modifying factor 1
MGASPAQQASALAECREEIGARSAQLCNAEVFASEGPDASVYLSAFAIDRTEVTVAAYQGCVAAGRCSTEPLLPSDRRFVSAAYPITSVTFDDAVRYCAFVGGRLPTEAEWERAARGKDGRSWPWGSSLRGDRSNHGRFSGDGDLGAGHALLFPDETDGFPFLSPVGAFPSGASPDGLLDAAGNAAEWTADFYSEEPPQRRRLSQPRGPRSGALRVLRGGSFREPLLYQRTTARSAAPGDTRSPEIGFRCAYGS